MDSSSQGYETSFKALVTKIRTIQLFGLPNFKPSRFTLSTSASPPPDQERKGLVQSLNERGLLPAPCPPPSLSWEPS